MESPLNPTRSTYFVIDSRDRNLSVYPLANHYEISLDEAVHDVVSLKLLVTDVPFVSYLISPANNVIMTNINGGATLRATVATGDYPAAADLATAVLAALQSTTTSNTFNTMYLAPTDNIRVTCNAPFTLTFPKTGSIALEMGFAAGTVGMASVPSNNTNTITPPFRRNLHLNPSVILSIYPASVNTSITETVNQSFAIVNKNRSVLSAAGDRFPQKIFNPPIARFSRFMVDFTNYDGSHVDFQNHEHRIELLLLSLRSAKYLPFVGLPTV